MGAGGRGRRGGAEVGALPGGARQPGAGGAPGGSGPAGGRQVAAVVGLAEVVGAASPGGRVSAVGAQGAPGALGLGGQAQGSRPPAGTERWLRHDARGLRAWTRAYQASQVVAGVGHQPGVALHVQDVRRLARPRRRLGGWGRRVAGDGCVEPRLIRWLSEYER